VELLAEDRHLEMLAVVGGEPHDVASSSRRMAGLAAPSSLDEFLGKAVPSRRQVSAIAFVPR
jgi:hypothetical protein